MALSRSLHPCRCARDRAVRSNFSICVRAALRRSLALSFCEVISTREPIVSATSLSMISPSASNSASRNSATVALSAAYRAGEERESKAAPIAPRTIPDDNPPSNMSSNATDPNPLRRKPRYAFVVPGGPVVRFDLRLRQSAKPHCRRTINRQLPTRRQQCRRIKLRDDRRSG